jgi:hypothetical protein
MVQLLHPTSCVQTFDMWAQKPCEPSHPPAVGHHMVVHPPPGPLLPLTSTDCPVPSVSCWKRFGASRVAARLPSAV